MTQRLAINGGPKAVTGDFEEGFIWPRYGEEEFSAVKETMEARDPYAAIGEFEKSFQRYLGCRHAISQNNGTSTLHSSYFAVGVGPGDEVITPSYSWLLQIMPIVASHGVPVFAEIDPRTLTIDAEDIRRKITSKTKAIVVVHTYGHPADMDPIVEIAEAHGIPVIEDCSHAHGAEYKGRKVGTIGDIGCFSLQQSKLLPAIEGGVLVTNNEEYHDRIILLGHYERMSTVHDDRLKRLSKGIRGVVGLSGACYGYKYRINPLAAAIANVRLNHLDETNAIRRRNMGYISRGLADLRSIEPPYESPDVRMAWLIYLLRYYPERLHNVSRAVLVNALRSEGVSANEGGGYQPFHLTELMQVRDFYGKGCPLECSRVERAPTYGLGMLPITESVGSRLVSLAMFANPIPDLVMDQYIEAFHKVEENAGEL